MSSLHSDKGWLFVAFRLGGRQVRLYLGLRDTRANRRSSKGIEDLILRREWVELARKFPDCKHLTPYLPTPDTTTFRQAAESFLEYQALTNKPATVEFYKRIIEKHITGPSLAFADKPIRLIGASDIAALYAPVAQRGHQAQAQNIRRVVSAVFQWARGEKGSDGDVLVGDNPVARTRPVVADRNSDREIDPFTPEEITAIIGAARPGWERHLVTIAFETGLRPNELFGLKRKDIELAGEVPSRVSARSSLALKFVGGTSLASLRVSQTYSRFGVGEVKNRGSRRTVPLSDAAVRALREQLAEVELRSPWLWPQSNVGVLIGDVPGSPTSEAGPRVGYVKPHNPQNFSRRNWPAILKRAGIKHRAFYQCRHTYAMQSLAAGVSMPEIAKRMGHTNLKMLIDHYLVWKQEESHVSRVKRTPRS